MVRSYFYPLICSSKLCYSSTQAERRSVLHEPRTKDIARRVIDDTSSLRANSIKSRSVSDSQSVRSSMVGSAVFPFDHELMTTAVYKRKQVRVNSLVKLTEENVAQMNGKLPQVEIPNSHSGKSEIEQTETKDSALGSSIFSHAMEPDAKSDITPLTTNTSLSRSSSVPGIIPRKVGIYSSINPPITPKSWSRPPIIHISPHSDPAVTTLDTAFEEENTESKSKWSRLTLRKTKRRTKSAEGHLSPVSSRRRARPRGGSDVDLRISIDFGSNEGLASPDLVRAAQAGSLREIEELLERGANINEKHLPTGRTPLAVASHCGNDEVVALFLRREADHTILDSEGMSPLHLAASRGHYRSVEVLLQEKVYIDTPGPDRRTSFRMAAENGDLDVMKLLLRHGAKVNSWDSQNSTALHSAARNGELEVAKLLLGNGIDCEAKDAKLMTAMHHTCTGNQEGHEGIAAALFSRNRNLIDSPSGNGMSPLCYASEAGSERLVKFLLSKNANVRHRDEDKLTPLHFAAYNGHMDIVDLLLSKKAPVDARTTDGKTALHLAVISNSDGRFVTVELLLRKSKTSVLESPCSTGKRPLHYACENPDPQIIGLLLGQGAQVNAESRLAGRPLHIAAKTGSTEVIRQLMEKGADAEARDPQLERTLCVACIHGHIEIVRLLLDRNIPLRSRFTSQGRSHQDSPLCLASKHGHWTIVEELIQRGSSVFERDENTWQPLRYAAHYGHADVVQTLLSHGASISGLGPSGGWGFEMTAGRIGFAKGVQESQKAAVLQLLHMAEEIESANSTRIETQNTAYNTTSNNPASFAVELPGAQRFPHPLVNEKDNDQLDIDTQRRSIPSEYVSESQQRASLPPPILVSTENGSTSTNNEDGSSNMISGIRRMFSRRQQNRDESASAQTTTESDDGSARFVNRQVSPMQTLSEEPSNASTSGNRFMHFLHPIQGISPLHSGSAVSPMPPNHGISPIPLHHAVSPATTPYPTVPTSSADSTVSPAITPYPTAPTSSAGGTVPGQGSEHLHIEANHPLLYEQWLRGANIQEGDVVVCESCSDKGLTRPDMSCTACQSTLNEYRYIMNQLNSDLSRDRRGVVFELPG
jgi:ankyrin repeat protein